MVFEKSWLSGVRTITWRAPGLTMNAAGTMVEICCGFLYEVGNSRPSIYMRMLGANLSPASSSLKSAVRAYTFEGETEASNTSGGLGGTGVGVEGALTSGCGGL